MYLFLFTHTHNVELILFQARVSFHCVDVSQCRSTWLQPVHVFVVLVRIVACERDPSLPDLIPVVLRLPTTLLPYSGVLTLLMFNHDIVLVNLGGLDYKFTKVCAHVHIRVAGVSACMCLPWAYSLK